jgi:hypothetical protein
MLRSLYIANYALIDETDIFLFSSLGHPFSKSEGV